MYHDKYRRDGTPYLDNYVGLLEWAKDFESGNRRVDDTNRFGIRVSTIWLGLNHEYSPDMPPLIFESMVFYRGKSIACERYSSEQEAVKGHKKLCDEFLTVTGFIKTIAYYAKQEIFKR